MNRILIYAPTVGRGGVHRVVQKLMGGFARHADPEQWSFSVLGQTYDEIGLPVEWPEAWPFEQLDPGSTIPPHPVQFNWLNNHQKTFFAHLQRKVAGGDYDLIYCPSAWWTMRVPKWEMPIPFVTTVPDFAFDFIDMGMLTFNFRHVAKLIADRADFVVFPSNFQRCHGERFYNYHKTRTIHHSADFVADSFDASGDEGLRVRIKYNLPHHYILAFHPMYHKAIDIILQAQKWARQQCRDVPPLVVAGIGTEHLLTANEVDSHIARIRELMKEIGVNPGVDFFALGRMPDEDIAGLYTGATAAVFASRSEGDISGGMFEAMMASTPLIFSDLPVLTERLGTDRHYGLHFKVDDVQALGSAIVEVCSYPQAARQRALNAFGFTRQRTVADVAGEYLDTFQGVLNGA